MKKISARHTLGLLAAGALIVPLAACSGTSAESTVAEDCVPAVEGVETINEGKLTALVADYPPFVSADSSNTLQGVDGELINRVAAELCLELDSSTTSFAAVTEGLKTNRADISAGSWSLDAEREEMFEVSDPVYAQGVGIVSTESITSLDDLEGKSIGTPQGYMWVEDLQGVYGDDVVLFQSETAVLDDIVAGRLDAGFITQATVAHFIQQNENYSDLIVEPIEPDERIEYTMSDQVTVALISKGNVSLKDAVNTVLKSFYESGDMDGYFEELGIDPEVAYPNR